jgi:hypothetical protein
MAGVRSGPDPLQAEWALWAVRAGNLVQDTQKDQASWTKASSKIPLAASTL